MSKRAAQVQKNLALFEAEGKARHPGQEPGPVVMARLTAMAWDHERPAKKPSNLKDEGGWRAELDALGCTPHLPRRHRPPPVALDEMCVQQLVSRALDRCAAAASTWTRHTVQEHVPRIITETGVRAEPAALRDLIAITTRLAVEDCLSVLPPGLVRPEHVAHLTSLDVVAAGAGKTTMLGVAIETAAAEGRAARITTPTKKAAAVAQQELGVPADSVVKLVHANGWRWNRDGVWTRLNPGATDPDTGSTYNGPAAGARLVRGERIVVDEAEMLDQDTALALSTIAAEAGATLALVGDRAQLPAVGRGGVLDLAVQLSGGTFDLTTVHRFTDPEYADPTVRMREGDNPALVFDRLRALGLIELRESAAAVQETIAGTTRDGDAITTATNDEARELNERIRAQRMQRGEVDDTRATTGSDGLAIGMGDVIQTRKNDSRLQVTNRQNWTVQHVAENGTIWAMEVGSGRKHRRTVTLPAEYVSEYTHLSYASTAYGMQGATVHASHTVLSDALAAAGVYVGMTRGQEANRLYIVTADLDDAREQFTAALERDRADRGLTAATQAAREAVAGLAADGPVKLLTAERARLAQRIEHAATEDMVRRRWGSVPTGTTGVQQWAEAVAGQQADTDPHVTEAQKEAEHTRREQRQLAQCHANARASLRQRIYGNQRPNDPAARAAGWRDLAQEARRDLAQIESVPVAEAAQLVRVRSALAKAERIAADQVKAAVEARAVRLARFSSPSTDRRRSGPGHDFGRSL